MRLFPKWIIIPIVLLFIITVAHGCSGGNPATPGDSEDDREAIHLMLQEPSEQLIAGREISIPVTVSNAADLYAFSFRVEYETAGAEAIEVDWGDFRVETDVVFSPIDKPGLLPIAYSMIDSSGFQGEGTICTLKFTIIDPSRFHIRIIDDPEYLVAYDNKHEPLTLTVGGEV